MQLFGDVIFLLPFCAVMVWYGIDFGRAGLGRRRGLQLRRAAGPLADQGLRPAGLRVAGRGGLRAGDHQSRGAGEQAWVSGSGHWPCWRRWWLASSPAIRWPWCWRAAADRVRPWPMCRRFSSPSASPGCTRASSPNWLLIAIPLFVSMGLMLERSGVPGGTAARGRWQACSSELSGGYGFAVVVIGVVMAASTGIIGASVVLIGDDGPARHAPPRLRSAPVQRGDRRRAGRWASSSRRASCSSSSGIGCRSPSRGPVRIGRGGRPGLLLGALYLRPCWRWWWHWCGRSRRCRRYPRHRRAAPRRRLPPAWRWICWRRWRSWSACSASIVAGIATPTEAAAIGAAGATLLALAAGGLRRGVDGRGAARAHRTTAMIVFVMIGASLSSLGVQEARRR
ncbi:MAG: hypothetical protein U5L11_07865 [Arhodomonas sp.]|nr:hypothetical protein [Arhodomonas sp.]